MYTKRLLPIQISKRWGDGHKLEHKKYFWSEHLNSEFLRHEPFNSGNSLIRNFFFLTSLTAVNTVQPSERQMDMTAWPKAPAPPLTNTVFFFNSLPLIAWEITVYSQNFCQAIFVWFALIRMKLILMQKQERRQNSNLLEYTL